MFEGGVASRKPGVAFWSFGGQVADPAPPLVKVSACSIWHGFAIKTAILKNKTVLPSPEEEGYNS